MRYDRVIELAEVSYETDALGRQAPTEARRKVFANQMKIGFRERSGTASYADAPTARYEVRACDYAGERIAYASGVRMAVVSVDSSGADFVRLDMVEREGGA